MRKILWRGVAVLLQGLSNAELSRQQALMDVLLQVFAEVFLAHLKYAQYRQCCWSVNLSVVPSWFRCSFSGLRGTCVVKRPDAFRCVQQQPHYDTLERGCIYFALVHR